MAERSLPDLLGMLQENFKYTNMGNSPGTYLNPNATLSYSPFGGALFGLKPAKGWVTQIPGMSNKINFSKQHLPNDQYGLLKLLAHESAHTTQNKNLMELFKKSVLNSAPYYHYSDNEPYPPAQEITASLRENEALLPKGKKWIDSFAGEDYLERLVKANPTRSKESIIQEVDKHMFPEFGVMHEGPVNPKLQKQQGFLEKLMQMFGR